MVGITLDLATTLTPISHPRDLLPLATKTVLETQITEVLEQETQVLTSIRPAIPLPIPHHFVTRLETHRRLSTAQVL